jgi:hypothetical protein
MVEPIPLLTLESRIKRQLRKHLRQIGFVKTSEGLLAPPFETKECLRALHQFQRVEKLKEENGFIKDEWPRLKDYFADGEEINITAIQPRLEMIEGGTWQSRLFRLASLTWSLPVSEGYGRRMRFLVWDEQNEKLIGLIALGDPVFNLKARDDLIGWSADDRRKRLVNVLDAYVLGALPPYNQLLGGKLVACLIKTKEVKEAFAKRYATTQGIISQQHKRASLCLVTTSSAFGRSSIYNRLVLNEQQFFTSIGYTSGWGHFHIPQSLFELMRQYLESNGHRYADNHRFGDGPNWKLRAVRETMKLLGLNPDLLRHGIRREVFICKLATNAISFLSGASQQPRYNELLSVAEVADLAKKRWIEPRASRCPGFRHWRKESLLEQLDPKHIRPCLVTETLSEDRAYGAGKL